MDVAALISSLLGLFYFTSWSLSFYPQPLHNLRRRSTRGTTIAYPLLNVVGFSAYTIYTAAFLLSPVIRRQYARRHPNNPVPSVSAWDLAFAAHGCVLVAITLSQFWGRAVWRWTDAPANEERQARSVGVWIWTTFFVGLAGVVGMMAVVFLVGGRDATGWAYIDIVYAFSYLKLYITLTKYIPQVIYNARRRSTYGWSIGQVLLDFSGGVASVLQLFLDAYRLAGPGSGREGLKAGILGNMAKFWLGNMSIGFDVIFMLQHYVLYGGEDDTLSVKGTEQPPFGSVVPADDERIENDESRPLLEGNMES